MNEEQPVESMMATIVPEQQQQEWLMGTARIANEEDDQECRNDLKGQPMKMLRTTKG